jgi:hypothetical protein
MGWILSEAGERNNLFSARGIIYDPFAAEESTAGQRQVKIPLPTTGKNFGMTEPD